MADKYLMELIERGKKVIPGGINSSIRNYPRDFMTARAEGSHFWDQNGKEYIDYLGAYGPIVVGYNIKSIKDKVKDAVDKYDLYGIGASEAEVILAEKVCKYMKPVERLLVCGGGSEATYHAIRGARAYTGRKKIIKMQGAFHGWHDFTLRNGSTTTADMLYKMDLGTPGMLEEAAALTLICRVNDLDNVRDTVKENKGEVAAIIIDPFCTTFGCMKMDDEFVRGIRQICDEEGIVMIFDEVVSGFRIGLGGACDRFDVEPDLVCMGKAIANGYPVAALGGKAEIMESYNTSQTGKTNFQATYYGHPLLAAAAVATIEELEKPGFYEHLDETGDMLCAGMNEIAKRIGMEDFYTENCGSLIGFFFGKGPNRNHDDLVKNINKEFSIQFRRNMIDKGHYMTQAGPYMRIVTTYSHSAEDIAQTLQAAEDVLKEMRK